MHGDGDRARNRRLLRVSRRVATFCWAMPESGPVRSVQLHAACGPVQHCGCQGRASAARPGSGCSGTSGPTPAQGLEEETLPHPTAGGQVWANGGQCGQQVREQGKPKPESSPISGGASVSPQGLGAWQAGKEAGPSLFRAPSNLGRAGVAARKRPGHGHRRKAPDGPSLPALQLQPAYR